MKNLSPDDRPREKLVRHGVSALGDNELVAVVLGSGCRSIDALAIANELLVARGGAHGLARSTCDDLARIAGVGPARAARVLAAVELGRRTLTHAPSARIQLRTPRDAAAYLTALVRIAPGRAVWRGPPGYQTSRPEDDGVGDRQSQLDGRGAARRVPRGCPR